MCVTKYVASCHDMMIELKSEVEGHLLVGEERGGAILGILLKLKGLFGPAHRLQVHPHTTFSDT